MINVIKMMDWNLIAVKFWRMKRNKYTINQMMNNNKINSFQVANRINGNVLLDLFM